MIEVYLHVAVGELNAPERLGDPVSFDKVLMTSDGENISLGNPYLQDVKVVGNITRHGRGRKIVVFKYKRRKGYRKKQGHRQDFSLVRIEDIQAPSVVNQSASAIDSSTAAKDG